MSDHRNIILSLIDRHNQRLLTDWLASRKTRNAGSATQREAETDGAGAPLPGASFAAAPRSASSTTSARRNGEPMRELLEDLSRDRAVQGFSPSETAIFVFSLKQPLFARLRQELGDDADRLATETWIASSADRPAGPLHHRSAIRRPARR